MEDKKISQLNDLTVNIDSLTQNLYVPVVCQGLTQKINLKSIIESILSKIAAVTPYESSQPGEQIDSNTLATITSSINDVSNRVSNLESNSPWPKLNVTLTDGNTEFTYQLDTCPGGKSLDLVINTSSVTVPNFYATLSVNSDPTISGSTATVNAVFVITNNNASLQLQGGQIGLLTVSGSMNVITQSGVSTLTLSSTSVDLSDNSNYNFSNNSITSKSASIPITCNLPQGTTGIQSVRLTGYVNGIVIPGEATYSVSNHAGYGASGYITLANNGS